MTPEPDQAPGSSLRRRLLQIFLALTFGPILLITLISGSSSYQSMTTQHQELLERTAENVEQKLRAVFLQVQRDMAVLSSVAGLTARDRQGRQDLVQALLLSNPQYQTIRLIDSTGKTVVSASRTRAAGDDSESGSLTSDYIRTALTTGKPYIGYIGFDNQLREPMAHFIYPLTDPRTGTARYALFSELRFKPVWDELALIGQKGGREAYIVNDSGRVVAHRNPSLSLRDTRIGPDFEHQGTGLSGISSIIYIKRVRLYRQVLRVVVEEPTSQANRLIRRVLSTEIATAFIALVIAFMFLRYFRNILFVPLEKLSRSARALSMGDYPAPIKGTRIQEVDSLLFAFNHMVTELKAAHRKNNEMYAQLSRMNSELDQENRALEHAEQRLRINQQQLKNAQKIAQLGNWEWDLNTDRMWWSEELYNILSRDRADTEPSWQVFLERVFPDDKWEVRQALLSPQTDGEPLLLQNRLLVDGTERFVSQRIEVTTDQCGQAIKLSGVVQDITRQKLAEDAVRQSEERYRGLMEQAFDAMFIHDFDGRIIDANQQACESLGYDREELLGLRVWDFVEDASRASMQGLWSGFSVHSSAMVEAVHRRRDGTTFPVEVHMGIIPYDQNVILALARDTSDRMAVEESRRLASAVFDGATEAIMVTDAEGNIQAVNPAFTGITGYSAEEVIGQSCSLLKSDRQGAQFYQDMWGALIDAGLWEGEIWNRRKNGEIYPQWLSISRITDESNRVSKYVALSHDITRRKQDELKVWKQANFDALTGLANRTLFRDRLDQALAHAHRNQARLCLMFIDLDRFKEVNDTLGHDLGDKLLQQAANRLESAVRADDTVARLGGDEFTVLLQDLSGADQAKTIARKLLDELKAPFRINGHDAYVSGSIGITLYPDDGEDVETLLKHADTAMYRAKTAGRNRYRFFTTEMNRQLVKRQSIEAELRQALKRDQIKVCYQPIVDLASGGIWGVEALVRWHHPERGIITPGEFIEVAEESGLVVELGEQVLRQSCQQVQNWLQRGAPLMQLSVNVSSVQFRDSSFTDTLEEILSTTGLPAEKLSLEITESMVLEADQLIRERMDTIRASRISLSLDDFGTGYSSLSYLKHLPVDTLKIDQTFISDIAREDTDHALVEAIVLMSNRLALKVVAEGVETAEQQQTLLALGCDYAQGYYYERPAPADVIESRLMLNRR